MPSQQLNSIEFEISEGQFKHSQHEADGIVFATNTGVMDLDSAHKLVETLRNTHRNSGATYPMLLDVQALDEATVEARKIWTDNLLGKDSPFTKLAVVGGSFWIRTLANMYARIASIPMKLFKTNEEALTWLKA